MCHLLGSKDWSNPVLGLGALIMRILRPWPAKSRMFLRPFEPLRKVHSARGILVRKFIIIQDQPDGLVPSTPI